MMVRKPDVVIVTAPGLPSLAAGYALAKMRRVPLIVEMRDAWPDLARDARLVQGSVKSVVEHVVDFVQHRADLVVTVTEGFAATLRSRGVRNVATVSNGVHLDAIPVVGPPEPERDVFEALYLGNHGESQKLDVAIRASALVGDSMHLHMVGHGTQRPALEKLARELKAPVTFHPPLTGDAMLERYSSADTCIVSLRDDWKSFETTVPSKTYEVLAIGRHVTAVVQGRSGPNHHRRRGRRHRGKRSGRAGRIVARTGRRSRPSGPQRRQPPVGQSERRVRATRRPLHGTHHRTARGNPP